jgi:hypothetical protein
MHAVRANRQTDWQPLEPSLRIIRLFFSLETQCANDERWAYADLDSPGTLLQATSPGKIAGWHQ